MSRKKKAKIEEGPWNKDKAVGQMAPFTPAQAGVIRSLLTAEKKIRDLALFNMARDTMLRASDLLPLRVIDITDHNGDVVQEFNIKQKKTGRQLTREQYANLVKRWSSLARLDPKRHSTHSMRRSKSAAIYDATQNLAACQHLLGYKSIGSTAHYLGVDQRKALDLAKRIKI